MINCRTDYSVMYARKAAKRKKTKKTPRYTVLHLLHELDRHAPIALFLFANGRCVEVDLNLGLSFQREENGAGITDTSILCCRCRARASAYSARIRTIDGGRSVAIDTILP
jgi:hypothetical protein